MIIFGDEDSELLICKQFKKITISPLNGQFIFKYLYCKSDSNNDVFDVLFLHVVTSMKFLFI